MKPLLIIGCCKRKVEGANTAYELYNGVLFQLINANISNVHDHFEVLILSAKHGLIPALSHIDTYDVEMPKRDTNESKIFAQKLVEKSYKTISAFANKDRKVFVTLTNDYLSVFDLMINSKPKFKKLMSSFSSVYMSRNHRGIGVIRGRLRKILSYVETNAQADCTLFRSGLANADEMIGMSKAGCAVGASLAYVSDIKKPHLFQYLIQALKSNKRVFLDNGLITAANQGIEVDTDYVFERYMKIISALKPRHAKLLSIVIPDNPFSNAEAIDIIKRHKSDIKWLAKRCDVILPVHKSDDIEAHATSMMKELNFITSIRVGIPCKKSIGDAQVRLSVSEIQKLFELKNPKGNIDKPLFKAVHFLALSEVSRGSIFQERVTIADMFGLDVSADACRTTAVMGNELTSERSGSVMLRAVHTEMKEGNTKKSSWFINHTKDEEHADPIAYECAMDSVNTDVALFAKQWNELMGAAWTIDIDDMPTGEAQEYCQELLCSIPSIIEDEFVEKLKNHYWEHFSLKKHNPSSLEKRSEVFSRLFATNDPQSVQLNLSM